MKKRIIILSVAAIAAIAAGIIYRRKRNKTKIAPATQLKVLSPTLPADPKPDITMFNRTYTYKELEKYMPIRKRDCNFIVLYIQTQLNDTAKTELDPDGVFGPITMSALSNFTNHLSENYKIDFSGKFLTGNIITYDNLYNITEFFNQQNT